MLQGYKKCYKPEAESAALAALIQALA